MTLKERSYSFALLAAIAANTVLVILKELAPAIKSFLKTLFMHHWVGHGIVILLFFFLAAYVAKNIKVRLNAGNLPVYLVCFMTISAICICVFYVSHVH